MLTAKEIRALPQVPASQAPCPSGGPGSQNGYCYDLDAGLTEAIVYVPGESTSNKTKAGCTGATPYLWIVWSSADGKAGLWCTANATTYPIAPITGLK